MVKKYFMGEELHEILQNSSDEEYLEDEGKEDNEENNQFATPRTTKCIILFFRYLYYVTLNVPTCFDPRGIIIGEPTKAILHKTKLATFIHSRHGVKESNS
jgi:hypothetical protein